METTPRITQEMINLYDEFTHVTLDRRDFMERLTKLAGSTAAATAIASMIGSNYALAQIVAENDSRIKAQSITYPGPAGAVKGYLVTPANATGKLPGVVVIHENRGLNPHIRDVTRRMALEGFVALGPDLLSRLGGTPATDDEAAPMFQKINQADVIADADAAVTFLKSSPLTNGKVGAVGFCFGGGIVNQMAVTDPDLVAGVAYYGAQPSPEQTAKISKNTKLMLHYGALDERITGGYKAYDEALTKNGIEHQGFIYEGANHAFNNDTGGARYNKAAADLAWSRTIEFFKKNLS